MFRNWKKDTLLFWVYDGDTFLGGGITKHKEDGYNELRWRQAIHPNATLVWERDPKTGNPVYFTVAEAQSRAMMVAQTVQRLQPGIRTAFLGNPADAARATLGAMGLHNLPSATDNLRRILGHEVADKVLEAGEVDKLQAKVDRQLRTNWMAPLPPGKITDGAKSQEAADKEYYGGDNEEEG